MPRERTPGRQTTRRYTDAEKADAVRLVRKLREELGIDQGTVQRIAAQLGYGPKSLRKWVRESDIADGLAGPDARRVRELEEQNAEMTQELRELRRANEILQRWSVRWAGSIDNRSTCLRGNMRPKSGVWQRIHLSVFRYGL